MKLRRKARVNINEIQPTISCLIAKVFLTTFDKDKALNCRKVPKRGLILKYFSGHRTYAASIYLLTFFSVYGFYGAILMGNSARESLKIKKIDSFAADSGINQLSSYNLVMGYEYRTPDSMSPASIVIYMKAFLAKTYQVGVSNDGFRWVIKKKRLENRVGHYLFNLYFEKNRVEGVEVAMHIRQHKGGVEILHVNGSVIPGLKLEHLPDYQQPQISIEESTRRVLLQLAPAELGEISISPTYFLDAGAIQLGYRMEFSIIKGKKGAWRIYVDGETGEIKKSESLSPGLLKSEDVTGKGRVYEINKVVTPDFVEADLPYLNGDGRLMGKYVNVYNDDAGEREQTREENNEFIYFAFDSQFDEVSAYYHGTRVLEWFAGFGATFKKPLNIHVHATRESEDGSKSYNNAFYDPKAYAVYIGDGDQKFSDNLGTDSDVVIHEILHHVIYEYGGITSFDDESGGIHEGTADFFTFHFNKDACLGESVSKVWREPQVEVAGRICLRTAEDKYYKDEAGKARYFKLTDFLDASGGFDVHDLGALWVASLWEIRKKIAEDDRESFANIVLKAMTFIMTEKARFVDFTNALLIADASYGDKFKCPIMEVMVKRGFYFTTNKVKYDKCKVSVVDIEKNKNAFTDFQEKKEKEAQVDPLLIGPACSISLVPKARSMGWLALLLPFFSGIVRKKKRP